MAVELGRQRIHRNFRSHYLSPQFISLVVSLRLAALETCYSATWCIFFQARRMPNLHKISAIFCTCRGQARDAAKRPCLSRVSPRHPHSFQMRSLPSRSHTWRLSGSVGCALLPGPVALQLRQSACRLAGRQSRYKTGNTLTQLSCSAICSPLSSFSFHQSAETSNFTRWISSQSLKQKVGEERHSAPHVFQWREWQRSASGTRRVEVILFNFIMACNICPGHNYKYAVVTWFIELHYKAVHRFGEFCVCCCTPIWPQLACSFPATWERPYSEAL